MKHESQQLRLRMRVLLISLFVSLIIGGIKWWAYFISHSVALKTDALESFINIVALLMAISAVYHAQRPADDNHPYGHGKIELFSAAIEGGLLLFASFFLLYESAQALFNKTQILEFNSSLMLSATAGGLSGLLGSWQLKQAKQLQSQAILADAKHILADFYTTLGVIVGLLLVKFTQLYFLDSVIAALVAILLLKNAFGIIRNSAMALSDIEDPELIQKIVEELNSPIKPKDVIDVHMLRSFRSGTKNFIDLHVVVPEFWDVRKAHDVSEEFCLNVKKNLGKDSEFHPHVEACLRKYCSNCEVEPCPVRQCPFQEKAVFTTQSVIAASDDDH